MPMPWPTGAPVIAGGLGGTSASASTWSGWIRAELADLGRDRAVRVHDPLRVARRSRCVRDECRCARIDPDRLVERLVTDEIVEANVARARIASDDRHPLQIGKVAAHRVEVGEEILRPEVIGRDQRLHPRAARGCTTLPSGRRSARSARRPRRGTRSRRRSPPPPTSSAAGTRSRHRAARRARGDRPRPGEPARRHRRASRGKDGDRSEP